jgi:AcrR family transcriptional regulator
MVRLYSYWVYSHSLGGYVTARKQRLEPRKPPIQKRSKATVDAILSAAAQVFEANGYSAGTTNRIAERAGVSVGTLYQYYPSKEAIAVALLEVHIAETSRRLKEWVGHMVAERHGLGDAIEDYVQGMLDTHSGRPRLQHMLLEETPLPPRVHRALLDAERQGARTVAGLLRLYPETRHANLDLAGFMLVQTVESLTHRFAAHPDEEGIKRAEFVAELVSMLRSYLSCEPGASGGPPMAA